MGLRSPQLQTIGDDFGWSMLDSSPNAILMVSGAGEIVFVGDRAAELFGWTAEDLLGQPVEVLVPEDVTQVHRAHRTRYRAAPTVRAMGEGRELWARRPDGSRFPVDISLSPIQLDGELFTVVAVRDTTDRVDAEDHIHRVLRALDATSDAMFIFDATTLQYSFVNEGAVRMVGYSADELLTMTPLHLNAQVDEREYRSIIARLVADPDRQLARQSILLRKDGSEVPVEKTFKAAPTGRDGRPWIIVIARDETERRLAAEELRSSQEALRVAERSAAIADDRERIARDLHDTVIQRLFGEALHLQATMAVADEPVRARIESTIEGLDETIRELRTSIFLLQSSRQSPGGLRGRLLDEVVSATETLGFEPRLQFDGSIESIETVVFDHLVAVLREALANIARHADAHNVRVAITVADGVTLTVTDDGVGPPEEVHGGHGLKNITERAALLGGKASLVRNGYRGAVLTWQVPEPS